MSELEPILRALVARDVVREVGSVLSTAGIPWAVLKGVALHVSGCRAPAERPIVDIDVLVAPGHFAEALRRMGEIAFTVAARSPATATLIKPGIPLPLDLHHRLFPPGLFRLDADAVLGRMRVDGGVPIPSPLDLYAHAVGHFAKGRLGAEDVVHLADFASIARHFDLAAARTARHLDEHGLGRAARYALSLSRDVLGDGFATEVLGALAPDPLGERIAVVARGAAPLGRSPLFGSLLAHSLNDSIPRAAASWVRQGGASARRRLENWFVGRTAPARPR